MAALTGFEEVTPIYPESKQSLFSSNLTGVTYTEVPASSISVITSPQLSDWSIVWGHVEHGRFTTYHVPSFYDDYYGRIHVNPSAIDLGFVDSPTVRYVEVWNSYAETKNLGDIVETGTDGLTLPAYSFPLEFLPLQSILIEIAVSNKGAANIEATYDFIFSDAEDPTLSVVGTRLLLFPVQPDWSEAVLERLEFMTDVMESEDGTEQRMCLRDFPRQIVEYNWVLYGNERNIVDTLLFDSQGRTWSLPLWFQGQRLNQAIPAGTTTISLDTVNRGFAVGVSLLFYAGLTTYDSYEIIEMTDTTVTFNRELAQDWSAGVWVFPLRAARMGDKISQKRVSANVSRGTIQFLSTDNIDEGTTLTAMYQGYPVFTLVPNRVNDIEDEWERRIKDIDYGTGVIRRFDRLDHPFNTVTAEFLSLGRPAIAQYRDFLHYCKGKFKQFWFPTFNQDMELAVTALAANSVIHIKTIGYVRYVNMHPTKRDLAIFLRSGQVLYRRIIAVDDVNSPAGTEALTLDQPHGVDLTSLNVVVISYLQLSRMSSDSTDIRWLTPEAANSTSGMRSIKE